MGDAAGDDEVVAHLFDVTYRRLVVQLHGVYGDLTEAEEVVQEAFARAVAQGRRFARVDNPEAWLRTVELQADEQAYLGAGGVDATGRLVVDVVEWSGDEGVRGIHASDGRDWSSLTLTRRHPEGGWRELWMVATDEALEVRSIPDGVGVVEVSTDAGRTWERLAAQ